MVARLLVSIRLVRDRFYQEHYIGEESELVLVRSGSFSFTCEGVTDEVRAGECLCFERGVEYHRSVSSPAVMYFFRFRSDCRIFGKGKITFSDKGRINSTIAFLDKLEDNLTLDKHSYVSALFEDIVNQYRMESALVGGAELVSEPKIAKAARIIERGLEKGVSLPEVAAELGFSYTQFFRKFKSALGVSPFEYLASLRIKKAKKMLTDTDMPINKIAHATGFECEYYFSNFFKKRLGISPSEFRRRVGSNY